MVWLPQERFSYGELSPRLLGMGSSEQVKQGCKTLENAVVTRTGGVRRRPGTKYVSDLPSDVTDAYLVPYQSADQNYMLVFGYSNTAQKLYVFDEEGQLVTWNDGLAHGPFAADAVTTQGNHGFGANAGPLYHVQHENRVYVFSQADPPVYFEKEYGATPTFKFGLAPIKNGSPEIKNYKPSIAITMEEGTAGSLNLDRTIEADADLFQASDVNASAGNTASHLHSIWRLGGGSASSAETSFPASRYRNGLSCWFVARTFGSSRKLVGKRLTNPMGPDPTDWTGPYVHERYVNATFEGGNIYQFQTVTATGLFSEADNGKVFTLIAEANGVNREFLFFIHRVIDSDSVEVLSLGNGSDDASNIGASFSAQISIKKLADRPGVPKTTAYARNSGAASTVLDGDFELVFNEENFLPEGHTTAFDGDSGTADKGGTVYIAGGAGRANSQTNTRVYDCSETFNRNYYGPTFNFGYGYSNGTGFPTVGASHQGRLFMGGFSKEFQNIIVGSRSGEPDDFTTGPNDDEGLAFKISNQVGNGIRWLISQQDLLVGSDLAEFRLSGAPLTPSNVSVDLQSSYGAEPAMPAHLGSATIFVTRGGKGLREFAYNESTNRYQSADLTDLADHLWAGHTRGDAYFAEKSLDKVLLLNSPDQLVVAKSGNSVDILSYRRENGVLGWSPFQSGDLLVSSTSSRYDIIDDISMLPGRTGDKYDRVWMIVQRYNGSSTTKTIEYLEEGTVLDSQSSATPSNNQITGLERFEGETIQAINAVFYLGEFTVTNGTITLPATTGSVIVGKGYEFKLSPAVQEIQGRNGFTHGHKRSYDRSLVYFNKTRGPVVAGYSLQTLPAAGYAQPSEINGWEDVPVIGLYGKSPVFNITHNNPYTIEIQSLSVEVTYSD